MKDICIQDPWPANVEWLRAFRRKAEDQRVPLSGMLELTSRCNLKCVHCYNAPADGDMPCAADEMTTAQVTGIIDEAVDEGCLYLVITGGDPMLRSDFPDVYRHAQTKGVLVTVLCNGTLVTAEIVDLFRRYVPKAVEVTLYGATPATHDAITQVPGSFERCWKGIRLLHEAGIRLRLKTVVMTLNQDEVSAMEGQAKELGVPFRMDPVLVPRFSDRSAAPMGLRVPAEVAMRLEMASEERARAWQEYYERRKDWVPSMEVYSCAAGITGFYVDASGHLSPCLMSVQYKCDILEKGFAAGWRGEMADALPRGPRPGFPCAGCESRLLCAECAALNYLETGSEDRKSEYVCELAKLRHAMLVSVESKLESRAP